MFMIFFFEINSGGPRGFEFNREFMEGMQLCKGFINFLIGAGELLCAPPPKG